MKYYYKWINLVVFAILLLFLTNLIPLQHTTNSLFQDNSLNPESSPTTIEKKINPNLNVIHNTRARYLDDVINLDDPEVQLTVIPADANDCNYGNLVLGKTITTGDIDNDGYNDLILGVPFADGETGTNWGCGQVMVIFGGDQRHPMTKYDQVIPNSNDISLIIHGPNFNDYSGYCVASGNIDGDDFDDIIISAPYGDGKAGGRINSGEIYVIYGTQRQNFGKTINLQNTAPDIIIYGAAGGAWPGYDVAGLSLAVGNVIGDSKDDIIIGAPYGNWTNRTNCGKVHVVAGNTRGNLGTEIDLLTDSDVTLYGARDSDYAGMSVAAGDLDGDSRDDIVIGSYAIDPYGTRTNAGGAYVVYGDQTLPSTIDLNISADVSFFGATASDYYGWALEIDNINGDQYDDLIVSALFGDGSNDALSTCGDIYIKYGAPNLLTQYDLNTDGYDVTLFGKRGWDYFGYSLATGNVNNDQYDDLLIGVYSGDGDQDGNSNSGEAYLILGNSSANLGSNIDPLADAETVFYGIDTNDYMGRYVHLGDFDADGYDDVFLFAPFADGPNNARSASGEFYTIYSRPPPIKNEFLKFVDGDIDNKTVLTRYRDYTFKLNVTNILGYTDIDWVRLIIDPDGYNISLAWNRVGLEFKELYDPQDLVTLVSTGTDSKHNNKYNYTIDFKLNFNWTFNNSGPIDCIIQSIGERSLFSENTFEDLFWVNNKLDIIGTIEAVGAVQGDLDSNDWVAGGEELTFTGLKTVYYNTTEQYPSSNEYRLGLNFNGNITDLEALSPGEELDVKYNAPSISGDYKFKFEILNIPSFSDTSNKDISLKIDADPPPASGSVICKADSFSGLFEDFVDDDTEFYVTWNAVDDAESGTSGYYYSTQNLLDPKDGFWTTSLSTIIGNGTSEGSNYVYVWVKDNVGNIGPPAIGQIFIDMKEITYANFQPRTDDWFTTQNITCEIQVLDLNGYGVDPDNLWYWSVQTDKWMKLSAQNSSDTNQNMYNISITAQMKDGSDSFIQFRGTDLAGNGPTESQRYFFNVDTIPVTFTNEAPDPAVKGDYTKVKCYITISDIAGSGVNQSTIQYSYTTSGHGNYSDWTNKDLAMITNVPDPKESSRWFVELTLKRGGDNYIRWRATDLAGNKIAVSEPNEVPINAFPDIVVRGVLPNYVYKSDNNIEFNAENTTDPDDELNDSAFTWSSNITGQFGTGKRVVKKLPAGIHHIILKVFDGQANVSVGFNITVQEVESTKQDGDSADGVGLFGFDENTSFFIIILIIIIIIIILVFLIIYSRERKARKTLEEKALGADSTYIPARSPGLSGQGTTIGPQLYDAEVTPVGMSSGDTMTQLPTTTATGQSPYGVGTTGTTTQTAQDIQQLPAIGGTTPQTPTQTPTPTSAYTPGAAPTTATVDHTTADDQSKKPQLPPASIYADSQPTESTTTPSSTQTDRPVFGEPMAMELDTQPVKPAEQSPLGPEGITMPEPETPPELAQKEPVGSIPELEPLPTEPEPEIVQPTSTTPTTEMQTPTDGFPEAKTEPEIGEPKPDDDLPLGLTPDSPEYQKRMKKDGDKQE